uniref:Uncharacterized protein n=1 Tax=Anguilla anguilla TaxID=7936 RepID=A0A0E9XS59_ANGAN
MHVPQSMLICCRNIQCFNTLNFHQLCKINKLLLLPKSKCSLPSIVY